MRGRLDFRGGVWIHWVRVHLSHCCSVHLRSHLVVIDRIDSLQFFLLIELGSNRRFLNWKWSRSLLFDTQVAYLISRYFSCGLTFINLNRLQKVCLRNYSCFHWSWRTFYLVSTYLAKVVAACVCRLQLFISAITVVIDHIWRNIAKAKWVMSLQG
jgi:hypothetical protein